MSILLVSVWWGCHNKVKQTIRLKQQKFIFPQFWRLEVQDDGSQQVWFLKASLLGLQMATVLLCPQMAFFLECTSFL